MFRSREERPSLPPLCGIRYTGRFYTDAQYLFTFQQELIKLCLFSPRAAEQLPWSVFCPSPPLTVANARKSLFSSSSRVAHVCRTCSSPYLWLSEAREHHDATGTIIKIRTDGRSYIVESNGMQSLRNCIHLRLRPRQNADQDSQDPADIEHSSILRQSARIAGQNKKVHFQL